MQQVQAAVQQVTSQSSQVSSAQATAAVQAAAVAAAAAAAQANTTTTTASQSNISVAALQTAGLSLNPAIVRITPPHCARLARECGVIFYFPELSTTCCDFLPVVRSMLRLWEHSRSSSAPSPPLPSSPAPCPTWPASPARSSPTPRDRLVQYVKLLLLFCFFSYYSSVFITVCVCGIRSMYIEPLTLSAGFHSDLF